jgi:glycine oxidase
MDTIKNIAILGAGIMGLYSAYELLRGNYEDAANITLYDPMGLQARNASWMAGGMLAPYSEIEHMDLRWVEAGLASIEQWRENRLDCGFEQSGSLLVAHPEDRHALERFAAHLPQNIQTRSTPQEIEPALPDKFKSGLYLQEEAHIEPRRAIKALCDFITNKVSVVEQAAEPQQIEADIIIDCRGLGAKASSLRGVKGEIAIVRNPDFTLSRPVRLMHPRYPLYIVPRPNNVFMIGATIIESDEGKHVSLRSSMELLSALYSLHPSFGEAEIIELSAGIRPAYPDNLPRIEVEDRIIRANGLFRHGFLFSPLMARAIADHIQGKDNEHWTLLTHGQKTNKPDDQRAA